MRNRKGGPEDTQRLLCRMGSDHRKLFTCLALLHNQHKNAKLNLQHTAWHDPLTGLFNRSHLLDLLGQARLRRQHQRDGQAAVLLIDLDCFKLINDSLGHSSGDLVLMEVARRLKACLRPSDHLARLGGDEFVVLLDGLAELADAERMAQRMLDELHLPLQLDKSRLCVRASIGIVGLDEVGLEDDVLRAADLAMYRAKDSGKARFARYSSELLDRAVRRLQLESSLALALEHGEFDLHFQPICQLEQSCNRVVGFEALLRWQFEGRWISPEEFIPILEASGDILAVGEWVLLNAAWHCMSWQRIQPGLYCAVNLSSQQLKVEHFAHRVARILSETGLPAECLILEITESQLMEDSAQILECLTALEKFGIRLALDDFGTGYSALSYLKRFPLHILKMDKSFISGPSDDEDLITICRAIIKLGHALKMVVVAEGVEKASHLDFLRFEGCDYAQGYFLSHALPAWQFDLLLQTQPAYLHQSCVTIPADPCI